MIKEASLICSGPSYCSALVFVGALTELSPTDERFSSFYKPQCDWSKLEDYSKIFLLKETASLEGLSLYPSHANEI